MSLIAALERIASAVDQQGGVSTKCAEFAELTSAPVETLRDCVKVLTQAIRSLDTEPAPGELPPELAEPPVVITLDCDLCKNPIKVLALAVVAYGYEARSGRAYSPVLAHKGQCHNQVAIYLKLRTGEARFCEAEQLATDMTLRLAGAMVHDADKSKIVALGNLVCDRIAAKPKPEAGQ